MGLSQSTRIVKDLHSSAAVLNMPASVVYFSSIKGMYRFLY